MVKRKFKVSTGSCVESDELPQVMSLESVSVWDSRLEVCT